MYFKKKKEDVNITSHKLLINNKDIGGHRDVQNNSL